MLRRLSRCFSLVGAVRAPNQAPENGYPGAHAGFHYFSTIPGYSGVHGNPGRPCWKVSGASASEARRPACCLARPAESARQPDAPARRKIPATTMPPSRHHRHPGPADKGPQLRALQHPATARAPRIALGWRRHDTPCCHGLSEHGPVAVGLGCPAFAIEWPKREQSINKLTRNVPSRQMYRVVGVCVIPPTAKNGSKVPWPP